MDWVQVPRKRLLEYVDYVERLSEDHTRLQEANSTNKKLADIIRNDYEARIDQLLEQIGRAHV